MRSKICLTLLSCLVCFIKTQNICQPVKVKLKKKNNEKGSFKHSNAHNAQWGSALVVRGQIFQHSSNYFNIWKITKILYLNQISTEVHSVKKTPNCLSFASVFKHSPHCQLQFQEGPNLVAHFPTVQWPGAKLLLFKFIVFHHTLGNSKEK